jgi:hypothetical protein
MGSDADAARDREITPARELRIERIADMMRAAEWQRGKSGKKLAAELGLDPHTIRMDAAIASRRVYAELMQDREAVGAQVGAALTVAIEGAVAKKDWKAVAQLSKVYADASGVSAPQRFEGAIGIGEATPADASRLVREVFGGSGGKPPDASGGDS